MARQDTKKGAKDNDTKVDPEPHQTFNQRSVHVRSSDRQASCR